MQFFKQPPRGEILRPNVDWGTSEPQCDKFDPTLIKGPTFVLQ